jgi:hypothetical protein
MKLKFRPLPGRLAVCRFPPDAAVPEWCWKGALSSITRAGEQLSIVCSAESVPAEHTPEVTWICLKLEGTFSFSQVGILASFIDPLRDASVPIFAISTYATDYVLVKEEFSGAALEALRAAGHELVTKPEEL